MNLFCSILLGKFGDLPSNMRLIRRENFASRRRNCYFPLAKVTDNWNAFASPLARIYEY